MEKRKKFDKKRALKAVKDMEKIRKSGVFDGGKTGAEIIRYFRDNRGKNW